MHVTRPRATCHGVDRMRRLVSPPALIYITPTTNALKVQRRRPAVNTTTTIGMDLGDKRHEVYVLNQEGERVLQDQVVNTKVAIRKFFVPYQGALVVIEAGTHSAWISREIEALGCEVLVGNPRKLRAIWASERKSDVRDAEMLARIGRADRKLLYPIHHHYCPV
jgi:hypothetical protein